MQDSRSLVTAHRGTVVKGANPKADSTALRGPKTAQATQEPWHAASTAPARRSGWLHLCPWVETHDVDSFGNGCSAPGVDSLSARSDCPGRRTAQEGVGRALLHTAVTSPRLGLRHTNVPTGSVLWCRTNPGHRVRKRTSRPYGQLAAPVCAACSSPERDRPTSRSITTWRRPVHASSCRRARGVARPRRISRRPTTPCAARTVLSGSHVQARAPWRAGPPCEEVVSRPVDGLAGCAGSEERPAPDTTISFLADPEGRLERG